MCLSIGTPKNTNFSFVPNEKLMLLGAQIFKRIWAGQLCQLCFCFQLQGIHYVNRYLHTTI